MSERPPFADALLRGFRDRERLTAIARRNMETIPDLGPGRFSDDEIDQLLNGFEAIVTETIEGTGEHARQLVLETAVPAIIADGVSIPAIAWSTTSLAVMLSLSVIDDVAPEQRAEAVAWLATFWGKYSCDVVMAALETSS